MEIPIRIKEFFIKNNFTVNNVGYSQAKIFSSEDSVLKIEKQCVESDNEHGMIEWLQNKIPVPKIVHTESYLGMNYLLMSKIDGDMSCSEKYMQNPKLLIKLLSEALLLLWSVNISDCPSNMMLDKKLKLAEYNVKNGLCNVENAEIGTYGANGFKNPEDLLIWLKNNKPSEEPVFSHGDFCLPNIFINNDKISGFIDMGRSGIADKYQDIALCYRSLVNNFSGKFGYNGNQQFNEKDFFSELGMSIDMDKIKYYILLDELF